MKSLHAIVAAVAMAAAAAGAAAGPRVSIGVQFGPAWAGHGYGHGQGYGSRSGHWQGRGHRHWHRGAGLGLVLVAPPLLLSHQHQHQHPVYAEPAIVGTPLPAPSTQPDPVIYPRSGQSPQQTEFDRQECNRWAVTQPAALADAGVFQRAVEACMDGRGYSVR